MPANENAPLVGGPKSHPERFMLPLAQSGVLRPDITNGIGNQQVGRDTQRNAYPRRIGTQVANAASKNRPTAMQLGASFLTKARNGIIGEEGYRASRYFDYANGNPTIGYGFNLNRPDARKLIEGLGYDYNKVFAGKKAITSADATSLLNYVIKEAVAHIEKVLPQNQLSKPLGDCQMLALVDLYYNGGPRLIGDNLKRFIKAGNFVAAANEIEFRSNARKRKPLNEWKSLGKRRKANAHMFRGNC